MSGTLRTARYRDVFANGEFRALWFAELVSSAGDQIARVALSVLVLDRTGSPALAALAFALTFLPALVGTLLTGLADRHQRREIMVLSDLARAAPMAVMSIPGLPLVLMFPLLFLTQMLGSPSTAARSALLADVLPGDQLTVGQGLRSMVGQIAQIGGFAVGGTLTFVLTPYGALAANAASFLGSAVIIRLCVRRRPAPRGGHARLSMWTSTTQGARLVWANRELRTLIGLVWMIGLPVAAEGLAVPYATSLTSAPGAPGWLLAANPAGAVVGAFVLTKLPPALRLRLMGPLAACSGAPLIVCVITPNIVISCVLFALSGMAAAYMVVAPATFIQRSPQETRGQLSGLMSSGSIAAQGICIGLAGMAATGLGPAGGIAVAGAATVVVGTLLSLALRSVATPATSSRKHPTGIL